MMHAQLVNPRGTVGVAPATTTIFMPNGRAPMRRPFPARRPYPVFTSPYADIVRLSGGGLGESGALGLICPQDYWMTGRPYGLPGTTVVRIGPDGSTSLEGAGLGSLGPGPSTVQPGDNSIFEYHLAVWPVLRADSRAAERRTYIIGGIAGAIGLLGVILAVTRP